MPNFGKTKAPLFHMKYRIEDTEEKIQNNSGISLIGGIFKNSLIHPYLAKSKLRLSAPVGCYSDSCIVKSMLGMLCLGHSEYESIDQYRQDSLFRTAMGITGVPSKERLRQRLDELSESRLPLIKHLSSLNEAILKEYGVFSPIQTTDLVPLDMDMTLMDNTGSHKEGCEKTYKKGISGFAPMMAYIGREGYLLNMDFRSGNLHSNTEGTKEFIDATVKKAKSLTDKPLLVRMDSAHDAQENLIAIDQSDTYFIIKHQLRTYKHSQAQGEQSYIDFVLSENKQHAQLAYERDENVHIYMRERPVIHKLYHDSSQIFEEFSFREIVCVVEIKTDKNGQPLLLPIYDVHIWKSNLPPQYDLKTAKYCYHEHGTSEQFHSEYKSDLGIEKLPSNKYFTNQLIAHLGCLAFNALRIIGLYALNHTDFPFKQAHNEINPVSPKYRFRIRTVLLKIIYFPSKFLIKHKQFTLKIPRYNPYANAFKDLVRFFASP